MIKLTNKELYEWRQRGATYQEMADAEGISRQAVFLKVKAYEKKLKGKRGRGFDVNDIVYKGLYEYFKANPTMNISKLAEAVFGSVGSNMDRMRRFLLGNAETLFKIKNIKKMMEITGKSFNELFELRKV